MVIIHDKVRGIKRYPSLFVSSLFEPLYHISFPKRHRNKKARLPVSFNDRQPQLYRLYMFCLTKRLWLLRHCQIQCTTIGNIGEFNASGLALLTIDEFRRLHVDVLFAVVCNQLVYVFFVFIYCCKT